MSDQELMLVQLGDLLSKIARPHRCDDAIPVDVRAALWQLGLPCSEGTSREEVIVKLWAKKRSLQTMPPGWGGPGITPPAAA